MACLRIMILTGLAFFLTCFTRCHVQGCSKTGWFGENCRYKCRCLRNACQPNGECSKYVKCEKGWFGPACQYADLSSTNATTTTPSYLRDGVDTTCNSDSSAQSATVTLSGYFPFTWFRVRVSNAGDLQGGVTLQFKNNSDSHDSTECENMKTITVDDTTLDIYCDVPVTANQVILIGDAAKSLCSLYISGGRNVALRQQTWQATNYSNETPSRNAVDGSTDGKEQSCTHTRVRGTQEDARWAVKLLRSVKVNRYVLYNRLDVTGDKYCCRERLERFILTSFNQNGQEEFRYQDKETRPLNVYTVISASSTSPVSQINITATHYDTKDGIILTLCEVEIYGDSVCSSGMYGRECENTCNCAGGTECLVTGGCPAGCAAGYQGETCNEPCPGGRYDVDCKEKCSTNCVDQKCNSVSGECDKCPERKKGKQCEEDCDPKTWGEKCVPCSTNCLEQLCNAVTGVCLKCPPGKLGQQCDEDCPPHFYGDNCSEPCSNACVNQTCDRANGFCTSCPTGKTGRECEEAAGNSGGGTSSPIGAIIGAVVGAVVIALTVLGVILWRKREANKADPPLTSGPYVNVGPLTNAQEGLVNAAFETDASPATRNSAAEPTIMTVDQYGETSASKPEVKSKPVLPAKVTKDVNTTAGQTGKSGPYYNLINELNTSTMVAVGELEAFMATHDEDFFKQQFNTIPNNKDATTNAAQNDKNKPKNRYKNICAYDHSRVHLEIFKAKKQGDYINACYIEGYKAEETFIASQGPTMAMLNDFIRMLWEQRVEKVVMLTNLIEEGKTKCEQYWPEDEGVMYDDIRVSLTTTEIFADYTIRRLQLAKDGELERFLTQFHFTSWPDKGVPTLAWGLVDFEQRIFLASEPTNRPIVVHCSAGVGRTRTFIALRNVMREAEDTGHMDFFRTVQKLRKDRINMVQISEQYEFLHRAAQVAMQCMGTTVTSGDILKRITELEMTASNGQSNMENEFKAICAVCDDDDKSEEGEGDGGEDVYQNSRSTVNKLKNRLSNILPKEYYRALLARERDDLGDYINAVLVPSFRTQGQQILTQLPLSTTVTDFWRLVTQRRVSLIVAFELDLKAIDPTIGDYLPASETEHLAVSMYNINIEAPTPGQFWETQKVYITTDSRRKACNSVPVVQLDGRLRLTHFKANTTDLDPEKLLSLVREIRSLRTVGKGPTLYMCRNGADYSGLVCVLSLLLDRMDNDHRLTVPLVVGAIKSIRPQVIPTLAQYNMLYQVLKLYSESKNVYSNMG